MLELIGNILMVIAGLSCLLMLLPVALLLTGAPALSDLSQKLAGLADKINTRVARSIMWLALTMALVQVAIVVLRYVFGINFIWLQESIIYMFGFLFLLTAGYALIQNEHVRVDIFYRDASERRKALVDFAGTYLFLFPICILIVWAAGPYVARAWDVMEGSREASGIQAVFILKTLIPMFAVLLALAGFSIATKAAIVLRPVREASE